MLRIDPDYIAAVAAEIRAIIGEDDDATFLDTLDGETNAADMLADFVERAQEAKALSEAAKARASELSARAARLADREKAMRRSAMVIMRAAGIKKAELPCATLSLSAGRERAQISDPDAVPTQLCKVVTSPDSAAILRLLKAGEAVPGAELVRGDETLTMRIK